MKEKILKKAPEEEKKRIYEILGSSAMELKRYSEAENIFKNKLKPDSGKNGSAVYNLAVIEYNRDNIKKELILFYETTHHQNQKFYPPSV